MPDVIGIRFKECGKTYDFEVKDSEVEYLKKDCVVVESDLGLSIGFVVTAKHTVENPAKELRRVLRKASEEDLKHKEDNIAFEKEARDYCLERIAARELLMKLVCTETTLDRKRIIFYFTADGRIDFREIVKDLAAKFKTRIEMRQIGVRDEAKIVGGFGLCGRELCCKTFLTSFEPISIKMAKQQELVLNMSKLSGICGRLMCCLGYEYSAGNMNLKKEALLADSASIINGDSTIPEAEHVQPESEVSSASPSAAEMKKPDSEKTSDNEQKKRKKWRWRKFPKK